MNAYSPPIVDGKLVRLSVSQLTKFDPEAYGGCKRRWWFHYVGGLKEATSPAQQAGTDGHKRLEIWMKGGVLDANDIATAAVERVGELSNGHFATLKPEDPLTMLDLAGIPFQGSMDVSSENAVYDYKFQSRIQKFEGATAQTIGYMEEIRRRNPGLESISFHYILINKKKPEAVTQTFTFTAKEVKEKWQAYAPLVEDMKRVSQLKNATEVEPSTKSCYAYGHCAYLSICNRATPEDTMSFLDKLNEAKAEKAAVELPDIDEPTMEQKLSATLAAQAAMAEAKSLRPPEVRNAPAAELNPNPDPSDYEKPAKAKRPAPKTLIVKTVTVRHQLTFDVKKDGIFSATVGLEMCAEAGVNVDETREALSTAILDALKKEGARYAK